MRRRKFIVAMISVLAMLLVFTIGLVACNPEGGKPQTVDDEVYYLSLKSMGWNTYQAAQDIPDGVLLEKDGDNYKLSIALDADDEFSVNKLGSNDKLGFGAVLSTANHLAEGESGNIKVVHSGAYELTVSGGFVSYGFTAYVASVQIAAPASVLELGQEYQFAATIKMTDDSETGGVSWSSSNEQVASVSESGLVTAVGEGTANIRATSTADTSKYAEYAVRVKRGVVNVESVTVSPEEVTLNKGETVRLTAKIFPEDADDQVVLWTSENQDIATVFEGAVTAVAPGITHIIVRTRDGGKEASMTVTVRQPVTGMVVLPPSVSVAVDGKERIVRPTLFPNDATVRKITATVNESGRSIVSATLVENDTAVSLKGLAVGQATIEICSVDEPSAKFTFDVTVVDKGTRLVWTVGEFNVNVGNKREIEIEYDNAEIQSVSWSCEANVGVEGHAEGGKYTATVTGVQMGKANLTAVVNFTDGTHETLNATAYVTEDFFFIYGTGLDKTGTDWDYSPYLSDKNKAKEDDKLLEQKTINTYVLERKLSPEMGFQIIFPTIASDWEKAIKYPSLYYNPSESDDQYVENAADQFKVKTAGLYRITLILNEYLTTKVQVYVTIELIQLDVSAVELHIGDGQRSVLKEGEHTAIRSRVLPDILECEPDELDWGFAINAQDAKIDDEYITIPSLGAEIEYYFNADMTTITVSIVKAEQSFDLTIECTVRGVKGSVTIPVLSKDEEIVPVTEVKFEQKEYLVNVNNGGADWATVVRAKVNEDATAQGVVYSITDDYARVDRNSGLFSATRFGVYTVTATAIGDTTFTDTAVVKVYSDTFYLTGVVKDVLAWNEPEVLPEYATSLEGTAFEQYKFTDTGDHVHFTLRSEFYASDKFQVVFLGMDGNWTCAMTYHNYDEEGSIGGSIYQTNFQTDFAGIYEITIDISGTTPDGYHPLVTMRCVQDYPRHLQIQRLGQDTLLKEGDTFRLLVSNYINESYFGNYEVYVEEGYEDYIRIDDFSQITLRANCTVLKAPESGILEFNMYARVHEIVASVKVAISASGMEIVAPKTVRFDQDHYYFNVNNGGEAWRLTVHAVVDAAATDTRISYSLKNAPSQTAEIEFETGVLTSTKLGTFTVVATALGDTSVTAETLVTFYSDTLYLIGEIGDLQTYTTVPTATQSLDGTGVYTRYAFIMEDETHFYLERTLDKMKLKAGNYDDYEYGFQIAFLGVDSMSVGVITLSCWDEDGSYQADTYLAPRDKSMRVRVTGIYRIEVSLEGPSPKFTVNFRELAEQEIRLDIEGDTALKQDDSASATLKVMPSWVEPEERKFSFEAVDAEGNSLDEYIGLAFNFSAQRLTATAKKVPLTGDINATIRVSYGEITSEFNVTIVAEHHLEMRGDDNVHWLQCVDCDYTEGGKVAHSGGTAQYYDGLTHYHMCSVCGLKYDVGEHFALDENGYHDGTHLTCECGFRLYDIDINGTITKYYGSYGKIKIPNEVQGVQVRGLGRQRFANMSFITDVQLCPTITHIDGEAFVATSLDEITIKADIVYGNNVYQRVRSQNSTYTKVTVEDGVTEIPYGMFMNARIDINFFDSAETSVRAIGAYAFNYTTMPDRILVKLRIPEGVESIGERAFENVGMYELITPDTCTSIGRQAFNMCRNLKKLTFGKGMTNFPMNSYIVDFTVTQVSYVLFRAEKINVMDSNLFGYNINTVGENGRQYSFIKEVYFASSLEDTMNMVFDYDTHAASGGTKFGEMGPAMHDGVATGTAKKSHRDAILYDYATHEKHAYFYSEERPAEDAYMWEFAGAWHYDEDGNVQKWSDTPLEG